MKPTPGDELPPAPWGSFPLAELTIFGGGPKAIGIGVVLAGLGGLEVAIREHMAGYRSHSTLLAGGVFVLVVALLFYAAGQILAVALAVGAVAFALAFLALRGAFRRASGGLSYRAGRRR
jgi:hypothetical protein